MSDVLRKTCLSLGVAGVIGGVALGVLWLNTPRAQPSLTVPISPAILVAARPIAPGALLRDGDVVWRSFTGPTPEGAYAKGVASEAAVIGSATRRGFTPGEAVLASALVRPDQRDFLAAVLAPGQRAVTIPIDPAASASGLVQPGDRVDVILVQEAGDGDRRMAAETVLHGARILALGHDLTPVKPSALATVADVTPKTLTLEASPRDARRLYVAARLGQLQLALRSVGDVASAEDPAPVWAGDVTGVATPGRAAPSAAAPAPARAAAPVSRPAAPSVTIFRGAQSGGVS
jgi:pilus assembly protein CpaB